MLNVFFGLALVAAGWWMAPLGGYRRVAAYVYDKAKTRDRYEHLHDHAKQADAAFGWYIGMLLGLLGGGLILMGAGL